MTQVINEIIPINIALISSYVTDGIWSGNNFRDISDQFCDDRCQHLETKRIAPDLYLFMETDVLYLQQRLNRQEPDKRQSAIQFMGTLKPDEMDNIVDSLAQNLEGVPPAAITTYLPEISSTLTSKQKDQAKNNRPVDFPAKPIDQAILNLLHLTLKIGAKYGTTPVVQMVAGSVIEKITTQKSARWNRDEFYVVPKNEKLAYQDILLRLGECFLRLEQETFHDETLKDPFEDLRIAFELEPGPLYLLDGPKSVDRFCNLIESYQSNQYPHIRHKIGFNLDIAHWWIKKIPPSFLADHPHITNRIFHSHISGHSFRAHFGDISLADMQAHEIAEFVEWLKTLAKLPEPFSGYVSLEFEAAVSSEAVGSSVKTLIGMVTGKEAPDHHIGDSL